MARPTGIPPGAADGDSAIARPSLDRVIADHLRGMIVRGEMAPGERLSLPDLAETFGVSTTPLREALKILAEEEIVDWRPGRGARVAPIHASETASLFDVIASLEALAAERAALRATDAELSELDRLHDRMLWHFQARERDPYFDINSEIHERVLALSLNEALRTAHARLQARASRGRYFAIVDDKGWRQAVHEHGELMAAFHARDATRAHEVWRRHLLNTGAAVSRAQAADRLLG
jgi:DNA-binding GntR family transcriptional regulator